MRPRFAIGWQRFLPPYIPVYLWTSVITTKNMKWHSAWRHNLLILVCRMNGIFTRGRIPKSTGARMWRNIFDGMQRDGIIKCHCEPIALSGATSDPELAEGRGAKS